MRIDGTRFGAIEFNDEEVITFSDGLIGFAGLRRYVLLHQKPESPFRWLQSVENAELAFLVADPLHWVTNYAPVVSDEAAAAIDIDADSPLLLLTTSAIPPGKPLEMTLNLAAPLLINAITRAGIQVVLEDEAYTMKYPVFEHVSEPGQAA